VIKELQQISYGLARKKL